MTTYNQNVEDFIEESADRRYQADETKRLIEAAALIDLVVLPKGVVIEVRRVLAFLHGLACIEQNHSDETREAVHNVFKEIDTALSSLSKALVKND